MYPFTNHEKVRSRAKINCHPYSPSQPPGFILGELEPKHADVVSQHWFPEYPEKLRIEFLRENIRNYSTSAVFKAGCSYQPVRVLGNEKSRRDDWDVSCVLLRNIVVRD